jgi:hypothetical protein
MASDYSAARRIGNGLRNRVEQLAGLENGHRKDIQ